VGEPNGHGYTFNAPNTLDPLGLEAKLVFVDGWHIKLVVERDDAKDANKWISYDFSPAEPIDTTLERRTQQKFLNEGVPGKVTAKYLTDQSLERITQEHPVVYKLVTTPKQDRAMEKEILRQARAKKKPEYKMTVKPWGPKADEGVCIQRPIQIVNQATDFDLPLLWLEGGMALLLQEHSPYNTYPLIQSLDKRAEELNKTRFTVWRERPLKLDKESLGFTRTLKGFEYFESVIEQGKSLSQAYYYWQATKKFMPIEDLEEDK